MPSDLEYNDGRKAGLAGQPATVNPFKSESVEFSLWATGWENGWFEKATKRAPRCEVIDCPTCETKSMRIFLSDGTCYWQPGSAIGHYPEPEEVDELPSSYPRDLIDNSQTGGNDDLESETLFCENCCTTFEFSPGGHHYRLPSYEQYCGLPPAMPQDRTSQEVGFVYVVRSEFVRIGKAKSESRYKSYKASLPRGCEILKVWLVELPLAAEDSLHKKYYPYRVRGSWYDLPPDKLKELLNTSKFPEPSKLLKVHESHPTP